MKTSHAPRGAQLPRPLLTVEDFRLLAKRRLPRVAFDFIDGAAQTRANHATKRRRL